MSSFISLLHLAILTSARTQERELGLPPGVQLHKVMTPAGVSPAGEVRALKVCTGHRQESVPMELCQDDTIEACHPTAPWFPVFPWHKRGEICERSSAILRRCTLIPSELVGKPLSTSKLQVCPLPSAHHRSPKHTFYLSILGRFEKQHIRRTDTS